MEDLQIMIIELISALEGDDDTYITNEDVFWDMIEDIKIKIPKENKIAYNNICNIYDKLNFCTEQKEIIKSLKQIYYYMYNIKIK